MTYDPTLYQGTAAYYVGGRPHYSPDLVETLAAELRLDGSGLLLDVGCGPGIIAVELHPFFGQVFALDPDSAMLEEGKLHAQSRGIADIRWIQARAEEISSLGLDWARLVTFGQSFHWTDRERVAEDVYDSLEPGGAMALINHVTEGRPQPAGPGHPLIPHAAIREVIGRFLGPRRRAGRGFAPESAMSHEEVIGKSRFDAPQRLYCPGRPDIVQDVEAVLANYLSTSFAAPHLFGSRLEEFKQAAREALYHQNPEGLFWDWPGDTEILLAARTS